MSTQNKVVKFKKRKSINIGIIVFLILFLYIAINVSIYFTKEQLSIYEVHEGSTAVDNHITGIILRDEKLVHSQKAGYISYFQKEGARIAKNAPVYSVDESGQIYNAIATSDITVDITKKDNAEIKHDIRSFQNTFSDSDFSCVYDFQENAQSTVLDLLNSTVINEGEALTDSTGASYNYDMVLSSDSGIISYYIDSYETVTPQTIKKDLFQHEDYSRTSLRTTEMAANNSPIYKLITSDTWELVLPLTKAQYKLIADKDRATFTILDDDFKITAALSFLPNGDSYYAVLTMDKYMANYLEERFLDVELDFNSVEGLKIPVSSMIEKDFYLVPLEYFSQGAESTDTGLIKKTFSESGEVTYSFVETQIYYDDGAYAYIDTDLFEPGTRIQSSADSSEYTLSETSKLLGVYNVNQGYAVFKRIEILYQNEEYCIVKDNTSNGLSAYDQIALDGSTAVNQAIIY